MCAFRLYSKAVDVLLKYNVCDFDCIDVHFGYSICALQYIDVISVYPKCISYADLLYNMTLLAC